jgi:hypothetical protein
MDARHPASLSLAAMSDKVTLCSSRPRPDFAKWQSIDGFLEITGTGLVLSAEAGRYVTE